MSASRATFEAALDDLGVTVSSTVPAELPAHLSEVVTPPAVGVPPDGVFDRPESALAETPIEADPTPAAVREAATGVTGADLGVADYGSLVLTPTGQGSELISLFPDRHVAVVRASDILDDMDAAVEAIDERTAAAGGSAIIATGPSATADMGALVRGVHGPESVHVVIVEGDD
ncbi:LUD domain-containing protein [Halobellus rubicundus]|uniref:LUD domain-containing protein n=1 Tax=Halobellus rubicundus TaxID=2996466 RepID=A0ABD5MAC2_9EURY